MSTKAIKSNIAVSKALSKSNRASEEARLASRVARLAKDAAKAAVAAVCAAERANVAEGKGVKDTTPVKKVANDARLATEEAVERAREAMKAESEGDPVGAAYYANLSARAAQRAASLSSAVSILVDKTKAMESERKQSEPSVTVAAPNEEAERVARMERELADQVDRSARYLVTYNRRIIATFLREEDAFLLEAELADIDRKGEATTGTCVVLDRKTGDRLGGYMITNGKMLVFVRDDDYEARYGKRRH